MANQEVQYDKKEHLQKIEAGLLPGESVEAVFDMKGGGTGFIGITSHRVIFHDKAFLRKMKAVVSIPYSRIHSVAAKDESGLFTGRGFFSSSELVLSTAKGEFEFEFRGADKAHIAHDLILAHMIQMTLSTAPVARLEAGGQSRLDTISKLAAALGITPAQLQQQPPE